MVWCPLNIKVLLYGIVFPQLLKAVILLKIWKIPWGCIMFLAVVAHASCLPLCSGGSRGGGARGSGPPPFGPRCRLFNIGPKVGPPLLWMSKSGGVFQIFWGRMTSHGQCPRGGVLVKNPVSAPGPPPPLSKILDPRLLCNILCRKYLALYFFIIIVA